MDDEPLDPNPSPRSDDALPDAEPRPSRKKADEELAALRAEVQNLRKELTRTQAERDADRKEVHALFVKLHPECLEPIDPALMVRRPPGTPDIFEEVLAEMERLGYDPL